MDRMPNAKCQMTILILLCKMWWICSTNTLVIGSLFPALGWLWMMNDGDGCDTMRTAAFSSKLGSGHQLQGKISVTPTQNGFIFRARQQNPTCWMYDTRSQRKLSTSWLVNALDPLDRQFATVQIWRGFKAVEFHRVEASFLLFISSLHLGTIKCVFNFLLI